MTDYRKWETAVSTVSTDYETLKHYADCGIAAVELSRGWEHFADINWAEFRENADKAGIKICSFHLPFCNGINIAAIDHEPRLIASYIQSTLIEKACSVGIKRFVVHPSAEPIADCDRADSMESAKQTLAEMAECAAKFGAVICVENLPRTCLGHNSEEMLELISADDRLRVCFDVNHLCLEYCCDHKQFIADLGDKIVTTHMSDYDFIDEKHFFPGMGKINWNELVTMLENADYSGPFLYEGGFGPSHWAPEVPFGKIEDAHTRHMTIKELYGSK